MAGSETRFAVLFFTDIVGATGLKARHGVPAFTEALRTHNAHFERLVHECRGLRILQNMGDGYFAEGDSVAEVVKFALLFQEAMRAGPWGKIPLTTRVGIHAGEIAAIETEGGSGIIAPAADLAARVMGLAVGGQILLTRFPFDEARHFLREHPPIAGRTMPPLRWLAHGPYLLKGRDEPMDIFEVGAEGLAPLAAPPDDEKAKRAIRPGEEETLGWRPAAGLEIPGRTGWHLTERLGVGGFGEVWVGEHGKLHQRRAFKFCFDDERLRALKREVALVRLLRSALGDRDDIVRFHELKLDAPPFYLESDLAPHGNLLQWAERQGGLAKIPLAQRIALVAHTATALAAAHSIGVLHKDIKPTNILIFDAPDGTVRPRLVDFGIGTLADPGILAQQGITGAGFTRMTIQHSTGTPTYSPPEYLAGRPYTIQGDIYGLGVLLYQLVTARPLDPLAPGWERDISDPLLREDIATCVDGDPARRFPSAADLAERLLHLDERRAEIAEKERLAREAAARDEAEAAATAARLRANRLRKLSTAFAVLALLAITGAALAWMNQRKALAAFGALEAQTAVVHEKKAEVDRKNTEYRAMLVEAARSDRLVAEEKLKSGLGRDAFAHLARAIEYDPASKLAAEKAVLALNTWTYPLPAAVLTGHDVVGYSGYIRTVQFSPDSKRIVTTANDKTARVWDAETGRMLVRIAGRYDNGLDEFSINNAQFSSDGTRVITLIGDGTLRIWEAATGKSLARIDTALWSSELSLNTTRIVGVTVNTGIAHVWDVGTGEHLSTFAVPGIKVDRAHFSPDGLRIVSVMRDDTLRVWDAATGKVLTVIAGNGMAHFSPDGTRIVSRSASNTAQIWDATTGQSLAMLVGHGSKISDVQFSPDGTRILTASEDRTARVWDAVTGHALVTLEGHGDYVCSAQFSGDGTRIVTASWDRTARVWDAATGRILATLAGHEGTMRTAQFSPDGMRIVTVSTKTVRVWRETTDQLIVTLAGHEGEVQSAQFSRDGAFVVTASDDRTARVWDSATGKTIRTLAGHESRVNSAQFSPDGTHIITASDDKTAQLWDTSTGKSLATFAGHNDAVKGAHFNSNAALAVTASDDKTAQVWDVATGKTLVTLRDRYVETAQFNADDARLVTASGQMMQARVWDAKTGKVLATCSGHEGSVWSAQFSPDGTRIVTASGDKTARVWDATSGDQLATLTGHESRVVSAHFSSDGSRIVTASSDQTARVWDSATGKIVATLTGHSSWLTSAQFDQDGEHIVTTSGDKSARIWTALAPTARPPPEWFPDFLCYMAQMRLNSDGELETLKPADWLALRERMRVLRRASAGQDTPYLRILRRFVPE